MPEVRRIDGRAFTWIGGAWYARGIGVRPGVDAVAEVRRVFGHGWTVTLITRHERTGSWGGREVLACVTDVAVSHGSALAALAVDHALGAALRRAVDEARARLERPAAEPEPAGEVREAPAATAAPTPAVPVRRSTGTELETAVAWSTRVRTDPLESLEPFREQRALRRLGRRGFAALARFGDAVRGAR